jgi:hypothetical protein
MMWVVTNSSKQIAIERKRSVDDTVAMKNAI